MAMESSREARRRKILDRGSDRLAFITGQAPPVPPSSIATPLPPPPKQEGGEVEDPVADSVVPADDNVVSAFELPKYGPHSATLRDTVNKSAGVEISPECEEGNEAADTTQHKEKIEPGTVCSSYGQVANTEPQQGKGRTYEIFTTKRISSALSASENIRMLCAISVALLVVLSFHGYPLGGEAIGGIISFRPIYLVLLTDASLMLGILFTANWKENDESDAGRIGPESTDWTYQMSKALEVLLVLQKVASAAFLDCCLCAIIIICGTSFGTVP